MARSLIAHQLVASAILLLVAACTGSAVAPASTGSQATQAGSGATTRAAIASTAPGDSADFCSVFTADRLASIVGQPVHVGDISAMNGMGCRWDTADGKGGVVVQRSPIRAGFGDIAQGTGQRAVSGVGDQATIGPEAFYGVSPDGPFNGTLAAALVGQGFYTVLVAPPPTDEVVIGLLRDLINSGG